MPESTLSFCSKIVITKFKKVTTLLNEDRLFCFKFFICWFKFHWRFNLRPPPPWSWPGEKGGWGGGGGPTPRSVIRPCIYIRLWRYQYCVAEYRPRQFGIILSDFSGIPIRISRFFFFTSGKRTTYTFSVQAWLCPGTEFLSNRA